MIDPRSIRPRIALIFVLIITSVLAATGAWNYFNLKAEREQQLAEELAGVGTRLGASLPPAVWDYNEQQISETVASEMTAPFVVGIGVSSHDKSIYSVRREAGHLVPISTPPAADIVVHVPLAFMYQGKQMSLGEVDLYASRQSIVEHQRHDLYLLIASIVVTNVVLLSSLYFALRSVVLKPLERLQEGVSAVEDGRPAPPPSAARDDEISRLSASFRRLAEKLQTQVLALQERESYLKLLLDTLAEGLVVRGRHHEVFDFNHSLLSLFAATADELGLRRGGGETSANIARYFRPDGREYDGEEMPSRRAIQTGLAVRGELMRVRRRDGAEFWSTVNATPLQRPGEPVAYAVVIAFSDVTRFVSAERELSTLNEDLERRVVARTSELRTAMEAVELASRAKSEFLSSMSHELRTPLNGILGFAQLLSMAQPPLSDAEQRKVGQIETAGWHLLGLIDDVLDLARIESGDVGMSMEPVDVRRVVDETVALVATMARERGLTIVDRTAVDGAAGNTVWALANRRRLVQVLSNLLSNAIKYNRPHGIVTVSVKASGNGRVAISVADTGRGFSPDQLGRLYQPFTRFKREGDSIQGTGIGLVITRNLVHLMGGELEVASVVDEGSTFSVDLAEAPPPLSADRTQTPDKGSATPPTQAAGERRLLYVEDNPANVELFEQIVRLRPGYRLTVATDGLSGLALARAQLPDLAVVDIDLPGIDGVELCRRLRADASTRKIPLIALSANAMPDDIARARAAGFDVYLTKPIDVIRMLAEIERLLPT